MFVSEQRVVQTDGRSADSARDWRSKESKWLESGYWQQGGSFHETYDVREKKQTPLNEIQFMQESDVWESL